MSQAPSSPTTTPRGHAYAPGARVEIRDEEWMVRAVNPAVTGGQALSVVGVSDLVRGREAIFLDQLDAVRVLDPRDTTLEHDPSSGYRKTRLYLESLMRQSPVTDDALVVGHRGAIKPSTYQKAPAALALSQPRARILIADGVGLGKTVEIGILLSELIRRSRGRRILVVALRSVLEQFQMELWSRFTIPLVRLDSAGIERVRRRIPASMNPFYVYDRVIISVDTLKRDKKYEKWLRESHWDAIVIDECQHVAERTSTRGSISQRATLARLLAKTCDALILASATPHDGRKESFASLLNLLDPTAVPDADALSKETVAKLVKRRFKKDVQHEVGESFRERELHAIHVQATPAEEALLTALVDARFETIGRVKKQGGFAGRGALFTTLLRKAALSSPHAVTSTLDNRLAHPRLQAPQGGSARSAAAQADVDTLTHLRSLAQAASGTAKQPSSKLKALADLLVEHDVTHNRVVVFSERIHTIEMLKAELPKRVGLPPSAFATFHGSNDDAEQQRLVREFGQEDSAVRVLLCSDAAAEGINLHFFCHRLVHYDIPWSFITLEQRNGRIDRFGQQHRPQIHVLLTVSEHEAIRGDLRVLERLIDKEAEAHQALGDVQALLGLGEAAAEEQHVAEGIEQGKSAEEIIPETDDTDDWLDDLMSAQREDEAQAQSIQTRERHSLFDDDLSFVVQGWQELLDARSIDAELIRHSEAEGIEFVAPSDLMQRFEALPPELRLGGTQRFRLTADRALLMREFQAARQREDGWPQWHLLWDQHPAVEWLTDRLVAHMARHAAPVVRVPEGVPRGQVCMLFQGVLSNRRSQPVLCAWFGVLLEESTGELLETVAWEALCKRMSLHTAVANDGIPSDLEDLLALRGAAVEAATAHMKDLRHTRAQELGLTLRREIKALRDWADPALDALEARLDDETRPAQRQRLEQQIAHIQTMHDQRKSWFDDTMNTDETPYLRLAAVFVPTTR